ncbi:MAG: triose-phosphate isomerase [Minisyncoccota bacterium]
MFDLIPLIKAIGYFGILGIVFAESGLFVGFFLPGDSLIFTAGFLASQGFLNIWSLIYLVFIGAVAGDSFGYAFGKKVGPMIFKKEDSFLFHKDNLNKAKVFYEKYGGKAVILARFMPGIRTFAPILAGVGNMKYSKFLSFNIIGGALWGIGLPLLGYYLGNVIPNIDRYIVLIVLFIIFISVLPMITHIFKDKNSRDRILAIFRTKTKYAGKLVVFNWKMNPEKLEKAIEIAKKSDHKNIVIAPPFVFIEEVGKYIKKAELGSQDLFYKNSNAGSFTGEISASELINLGVRYAIIGHSERRAMGETNEIISNKIKAALNSGLIPIFCIGESIEDHKNGLTKKILEEQIRSGLSLINDHRSSITAQIIIAYEPIWAIGSGNPETPELALDTIKFIKNITEPLINDHKLLVLYGGSVDPKNIYEFIGHKEIDGVLIGRASLSPELFFK